jgi:hypothetical protein
MAYSIESQPDSETGEVLLFRRLHELEYRTGTAYSCTCGFTGPDYVMVAAHIQGFAHQNRQSELEQALQQANGLEIEELPPFEHELERQRIEAERDWARRNHPVARFQEDVKAGRVRLPSLKEASQQQGLRRNEHYSVDSELGVSSIVPVMD